MMLDTNNGPRPLLKKTPQDLGMSSPADPPK